MQAIDLRKTFAISIKVLQFSTKAIDNAIEILIVFTLKNCRFIVC